MNKKGGKMDSQITVLPKDQKQVVAKTMLDLNVSAKNIADILGVHRATVYRYSDKPTKPELQQFATELKTLMSVKQQTLLAKVIKRMEDIIDDKGDDSFDLRSLSAVFLTLKKTTQSLVDIKNEEASHRLLDKYRPAEI